MVNKVPENIANISAFHVIINSWSIHTIMQNCVIYFANVHKKKWTCCWNILLYVYELFNPGGDTIDDNYTRTSELLRLLNIL